MSRDHPVVDVLRTRYREDSRPGARSDDHKVALAVEGGGMRGVLSAAMVTAIKDRGLRNAFDEIYAVSAGAVNSAYLRVVIVSTDDAAMRSCTFADNAAVNTSPNSPAKSGSSWRYGPAPACRS